MHIQGIIMDFDGLILDTESPTLQAWQTIFAQHGQVFPLTEWSKTLGSDYLSFKPLDILESLTQQPLPRTEVAARQQALESKLLAAQTILPGVEDYLLAARKKHLKIGLASSADREWVHGHLARLDLLHWFDCIHTAEDVDKLKPDPALYLLTLHDLQLAPENTLVFEDSPNGIKAAQAAGIFSIAVPNPVTRGLDTSFADLQLDSLAHISLETLLADLQSREK